MVAPGYVMAKSKNKIVMHIKTDAFFEPQPEDSARYDIVSLYLPLVFYTYFTCMINMAFQFVYVK